MSEREYREPGPIVKITTNGTVSPFVSSGLDRPQGLAFDSAGNLYEADLGTNTVKKFSSSGSLLDASFGIYPPGMIYRRRGHSLSIATEIFISANLLVCRSGKSRRTNRQLLLVRTTLTGSIGGIAFEPPTAYDFNQDGKPDYVLYNAVTHQTAVWYLNNNVFVGGAYGPTLPANWNVVGVADFNADGMPDYVLYNAVTHQTGVWYLNNNVFVGGAYGPTLPANWNVVGVADFNAR